MRVSALQCKKPSNRFKRFFAMHHPVDSPTGRIALSPIAPVFKGFANFRLARQA
jgi:hypothetical protein